MRLHVGNGSIFLRNWLNVDLPLPHVFLASERPDLVEKFVTSDADYYSRHEDKDASSLRAGPVTKETVCDVYGSFGFLPARTGTVAQLWSVQVFEHLDRHEARQAIGECGRVLKSGGLLQLDVPDPDETMRQYLETKDEFYVRHLFGPRRNVYGFHTHYTRAMLKELVEEGPFEFAAERPNLHFYPAFSMDFRRK